ncbi:hypothetical protein NPIL_435601 [Nephila pilipes]|uniref:Uncharacterized protein n=1 Tax=Nephila pilipes TaxID=299642 RepID=A0A8X6PW78_NEPPI|nr:hypothetical protein NPIL_435601 [Nephila pilipes]
MLQPDRSPGCPAEEFYNLNCPSTSHSRHSFEFLRYLLVTVRQCRRQDRSSLGGQSTAFDFILPSWQTPRWFSLTPTATGIATTSLTAYANEHGLERDGVSISG